MENKKPFQKHVSKRHKFMASRHLCTHSHTPAYAIIHIIVSFDRHFNPVNIFALRLPQMKNLSALNCIYNNFNYYLFSLTMNCGSAGTIREVDAQAGLQTINL